MKVLIDTHALLWMLGDSGNLSHRAQSVLANRDNSLLFSIAGYWEIGIKTSIGKLKLSSDWQETIPRAMTRNGVKWLEITPDHVHAVSTLQWIHRDPFDRIMIAQAMRNDLKIVTADPAFHDYSVTVIW
ncbi:MAG TPA: type II toxin-antitoxin system VapC family toxin [Alkalispirochaeta sp.]|nr:type II toxin-antitoxin system VapC family toxin [Alkalispirochaeta sp.]